jgi:hypothetical protein
VQIAAIIANLDDTPNEGIAVALADAIFHLEDADSRRFLFCVEEADTVRMRLQRNGFDIVSVAGKSLVESTLESETETEPQILLEKAS